MSYRATDGYCRGLVHETWDDVEKHCAHPAGCCWEEIGEPGTGSLEEAKREIARLREALEECRSVLSKQLRSGKEWGAALWSAEEALKEKP